MEQTIGRYPTVMMKLKPHAEMIAALLSGVLILTAWLTGPDHPTISIPLFLASFLIGGFAKAKEGIEETFKNKSLNVEMLMIFAAIGSAIIGYWTEGAILIFIFSLSGALETYTLNKSKKELSSLMELQPEEAWLIDDHGQIHSVLVKELSVGSTILIKSGERVPIDGVILKGKTVLDESAITGESMPAAKKEGDSVFAGTVNQNGAITVTMTKPGNETLFQKIIDLVQSAQSEQSPSQQFIERFEGTYVKIVLLIVGLMLFLPHFALGWDWNTTFYRAIVLLVVASPCALVASVMPATLAAISNGARNGILVKGGVHLENLSQITAIAFDKTGTLTKGNPIVTDVEVAKTEDPNWILNVAGAIETNSSHPLAKAISSLSDSTHSSIEVEHLRDVPGLGVEASIGGHLYKIGNEEFVGNVPIAFSQELVQKWKAEGKTVVFLADEHKQTAAFALKDTIRPQTKDAISRLAKQGIHTIMLTGDHETTASTIALEAGISEYVANCLPETKAKTISDIKKTYPKIAMVGDGINDAPALATATTGIAMGEGTDVALETADIVLMKNDLSKIEYALRLSKKMQRIVKQNVFFSLGVILLLVLSNFMQVLNLPFGVIGHEGSTILVILNGLRLLKTT